MAGNSSEKSLLQHCPRFPVWTKDGTAVNQYLLPSPTPPQWGWSLCPSGSAAAGVAPLPSQGPRGGIWSPCPLPAPKAGGEGKNTCSQRPGDGTEDTHPLKLGSHGVGSPSHPDKGQGTATQKQTGPGGATAMKGELQQDSGPSPGAEGVGGCPLQLPASSRQQLSPFLGLFCTDTHTPPMSANPPIGSSWQGRGCCPPHLGPLCLHGGSCWDQWVPPLPSGSPQVRRWRKKKYQRQKGIDETSALHAGWLPRTGQPPVCLFRAPTTRV